MSSGYSVSARDLGVGDPVAFDSMPWGVIDFGYGKTEFKLLRVSLRDNSSTSLIRWQAGIEVPKHRHFGAVHAITFKGRWHYKEYAWHATPGSYLVEAPETEHSLVVDEDTEVLFITYGGMVDLDAQGKVVGYSDAQKALADARAVLDSMGLELPDSIIRD
jgi:quercetin dioxygenase-like cupin family protein